MASVLESRNEYQREWQGKQRANQRDLTIPDVADPVRREDLSHDDEAWLRFYLPDVFFNPFTEDQKAMIRDVGYVLRFGVRQCKAMPRGSGKSTIVKYLILKYALERKVLFPLVIAATFGKAQKTTSSLRRRLASKQDSPLAADYPLECHTARYVNPWPSRARNCTANGGRSIHVEWGAKDGYFILPSWEDEEPVGPIMMSLGWSSDELQGCNIYDRRPDCVMLDDLDSRESLSAENGRVAEKIGEAITKTIAGLVGQSQRLGQYFICTITSPDSAAFRFSDPKQEPAWDGKRVAAIKVWPTNDGLWEEYCKIRTKGKHEGDIFGRNAHEFYLTNREAMDLDAVESNPYDFDADEAPDGSQMEVSNLQRCYNYIADNGREAFDTEYQNDPPIDANRFVSSLSNYSVINCEGEFAQFTVDEDTEMVVRGVDVRKIELHHCTIGSGPTRLHRIPDYGVQSHGTTETTVEMAEELILEGLHRLTDKWEAETCADLNGNAVGAHLTLIDCGWLGNWTEDGEKKTWVTQPVETFCMERSGGHRRWLPAKGQPNYKPPNPGRSVIIGDNWHINRATGRNKHLTQVVWSAEHWHSLVEDLFVTDDEEQRFELFQAPYKGICANHKRFSEHMRYGSEDLADLRQRNGTTKKPRFRRDHWWDSLAMALVAKSIEHKFRDLESNRKPSRSLSQMRESAK